MDCEIVDCGIGGLNISYNINWRRHLRKFRLNAVFYVEFETNLLVIEVVSCNRFWKSDRSSTVPSDIHETTFALKINFDINIKLSIAVRY